MHVQSYREIAAVPDALIHTFHVAAGIGECTKKRCSRMPPTPQATHCPNMAMRRCPRLFWMRALRNCDNGHGSPISSGERIACVQKLLQESPCHLHVIVWSPRCTTTTHRCHEPYSPCTASRNAQQCDCVCSGPKRTGRVHMLEGAGPFSAR
jgi:hypothetical protein